MSTALRLLTRIFSRTALSLSLSVCVHMPDPRVKARRMSDHAALKAQAAVDEAAEEQRYLEARLKRQASESRIQLEAAEQRFAKQSQAMRERFDSERQQQQHKDAPLAATREFSGAAGGGAAAGSVRELEL